MVLQKEDKIGLFLNESLSPLPSANIKSIRSKVMQEPKRKSKTGYGLSP